MMKRLLCLMLCALLLAGLFGCHYSESGDILEPVAYFYPRRTDYFVYGSADGVLTSEIREAAGHTEDLLYLLSMYLRGPQDPGLYSPFPANCKLENIRVEDNTLHIRLSEEFALLENVELTLACAALAKTCLELTELTYIHINSQSDRKTISITMDENTLLLADYSAFETQAATE